MLSKFFGQRQTHAPETRPAYPELLCATGVSSRLHSKLLAISFLLTPYAPSKVPRCLGHLALAEFCQQYFVNRAISALRANDGFLEIGAHGLFINPYRAHITIKFLAALFALEVDRHLIPAS